MKLLSCWHCLNSLGCSNLKTYLKRRSKQLTQKRCPHDVCQGSLKTFLQIGHSSRSSSLSTNFASKVDLWSTATTMVYTSPLYWRNWCLKVCFKIVPCMHVRVCVYAGVYICTVCLLRIPSASLNDYGNYGYFENVTSRFRNAVTMKILTLWQLLGQLVLICFLSRVEIDFKDENYQEIRKCRLATILKMAIFGDSVDHVACEHRRITAFGFTPVFKHFLCKMHKRAEG